jgi:hypothetical protein
MGLVRAGLSSRQLRCLDKTLSCLDLAPKGARSEPVRA